MYITNCTASDNLHTTWSSDSIQIADWWESYLMSQFPPSNSKSIYRSYIYQEFKFQIHLFLCQLLFDLFKFFIKHLFKLKTFLYIDFRTYNSSKNQTVKHTSASFCCKTWYWWLASCKDSFSFFAVFNSSFSFLQIIQSIHRWKMNHILHFL